ncbi:OmpA family protein [Thiorhodovibrio frisius]|uniref:Outer membrane protein/peptidoglycan-associated (Lipo)protein n=1 Tax=Thiorhodovibrio frisius TaxID=631362 RepID=H8Z052_9GAMM|nr:OmpA family protein [Thiorhodovibrio frisius]EIC21225.1 outer membrane protein/peptidoglycan-associated (lipo)protein [Thiorhodovibrio frisius]WPL23801.1 Inner membrane lipoprotein YiaD precursor [Thiorhodovibrio frisius]
MGSDSNNRQVSVFPAVITAVVLGAGAVSVAHAEFIERFWSGADGAGWTNSSGECWQSQSGASNLAPCAAAPEIIDSLTIELVNDEFDFNSAAIKPEMAAALDGVAQDVRKSSGDEMLIIIGHTDGVGSQDYNYELGLRRAESTKDYLGSIGIPASRMLTRSAGKLEPIATNDTDAGRARNRRIEIRTQLFTQAGQGIDVDIQ